MARHGATDVPDVMTALLLTAAGAWFMAGAGWVVQAVHYPLFAGVGTDGWLAYHAAHSRRITFVVLPAMSVELLGALVVAVEQPRDIGAGLALAGFGCAFATWVITGLAAVPAHTALGHGFDAAVHRRLLRVDRARTILWSAHGVLAAVMVAQGAG